MGGGGARCGGRQEQVSAQVPAVVVLDGPEGTELDIHFGSGAHHQGPLQVEVEIQGGGRGFDDLDETSLQGFIGKVVLDLGFEINAIDLVFLCLLLVLVWACLLDEPLNGFLEAVDAEDGSLLVASDCHCLGAGEVRGAPFSLEEGVSMLPRGWVGRLIYPSVQ